jgi:hypothetical protein
MKEQPATMIPPGLWRGWRVAYPCYTELTMETDNRQQKLDKYRQLLGIPDACELTTLKKRYAVLFDKFETQLRSRDDAIAQKGRKNMQLLDQAFNALATDIRTRTAEQPGFEITVEHASMRVGFQVLEAGSKFFVMERTRISGFGSTRTNNILSASWPAGKLTIFNDYLELKCLLGSHQLRFRDIVAIDTVWYIPFWLRVKQKSRDAESVHIFGWGLGRKLKETVKRNRLALKLNYPS